MKDPFQAITDYLQSPAFRLTVNLFILFVVVLWGSLVFWTYRDARRRGALALYWATVSAIFPVAGWLVYMIVRPPEYMEDARERDLEIKAKESMLGNTDLVCPSCLKSVEKDFLICPYCRRRLKAACPSCERPLKIGWTICPYCQETL
ncbi:MAG: zinc ribbon domain-containing protein [Candidatus Aquicultorales bacterium]